MKRLLVVVDMNNGFAKQGTLYDIRVNRLIAPLAKFCRLAKTEGWQILALTDSHKSDDAEFALYPPHCIAGTPEAEIVAEILPFCDFVLPKQTTGSFFEIQAAAKNEPICDLYQYNEIHIVGCCTDICIFNFALLTQKYFEYIRNTDKTRTIPRVIVHRDLCDTFDRPDHPAERINAETFQRLTSNGVELV